MGLHAEVVSCSTCLNTQDDIQQWLLKTDTGCRCTALVHCMMICLHCCLRILLLCHNLSLPCPCAAKLLLPEVVIKDHTPSLSHQSHQPTSASMIQRLGSTAATETQPLLVPGRGGFSLAFMQFPIHYLWSSFQYVGQS